MHDPYDPHDSPGAPRRGTPDDGIGETLLTDGEAQALLAQLCGRTNLDTVTRIAVLEDSAGSPLVLRELVRQALERGYSPGRHDPLLPHAEPLPTRIVDLFRARLAALTAGQLAGLAVLGRLHTLPAELGGSLFSDDELAGLLAHGSVWQEPSGDGVFVAHRLLAQSALLLADPAGIIERERSATAAVLAAAARGRVPTDREAVLVAGCWQTGSTLEAEVARHGTGTVAAVLVGAARQHNRTGYPAVALAAAWRAHDFQPSTASSIEYSRALAATRSFERALAVLAAARSRITSVAEAVELVRWWGILAARQPGSPNELRDLADGAAGWGFPSDELDGEVALVRLAELYRSLDRPAAARFAEATAGTVRFEPLVRARAANFGSILWSLLGTAATSTTLAALATSLLEEQRLSPASVADPGTEIGTYIFAFGMAARLLDGASLDASHTELDREVRQRIRDREYFVLGHLSYAAGELARYRGDVTAAVTEFRAAHGHIMRLDPRGMETYAKTRLALVLGDAGQEGEAFAFLQQAEVSALDFGANVWANALIGYTRAVLEATGPPPAATGAEVPILAAKLLYRRFVEGAAAVEVVGAIEVAASRLGSPLISAAALHVRSFLERDAAGLDRAAAGFARIDTFGYAHLAAGDAAQLHRERGDRPAAQLSQLRARDFGAHAGEPVPAGVGELSYAGLLSDRERGVALLAAEGMSNRQVAAALSVSLRSVETYLRQARQKLALDSRAELTALLRRERGL